MIILSFFRIRKTSLISRAFHLFQNPHSETSNNKYQMKFVIIDLFCRLPENVSFEEGALVEALAVVVHACRRVDIRVGHNVLVCGAGPVGIMAALCAKAFGANKVFVTDVIESRLSLAKELGVDGVYLIDPKSFDPKQAAKEIREQMGSPPEVTIECSGVESSGEALK